HDLKALGLQAFEPGDDDLDTLIRKANAAKTEDDDDDDQIPVRKSGSGRKPVRPKTVKKPARSALVRKKAARAEGERRRRTV
ncbi:MAG: hypothetical protein AB7P02_28915, partial [Alphaproteobacteria bacterium]